MDREAVKRTVTELIEDVLNLDELDLKDTDTAQDVDGWDSLSHIRIMATIERRFGIRFSNAEIEKFDTVGDLVDAIQAKQSR